MCLEGVCDIVIVKCVWRVCLKMCVFEECVCVFEECVCLESLCVFGEFVCVWRVCVCL